MAFKMVVILFLELSHQISLVDTITYNSTTNEKYFDKMICHTNYYVEEE